MLKNFNKKWPESKLERDLKRIIKRESRRAIHWLFFYSYKDKMDAFLHVIDVLALIFIFWRVIWR